MSGALDGPSALLADLDGDGFADALAGDAWIGTADIDAAVDAAADLLGALAARALRLRLTPRTWTTPQPALFFGSRPPDALPTATAGSMPARQRLCPMARVRSCPRPACC